MKNKILSVILLTALTLTTITGCSLPTKVGNADSEISTLPLEDEEYPVDVQPNINTTVQPGTLFDEAWLTETITQLTGSVPTDFICYLDDGTTAKEFTAVEGVHTVSIVYNTDAEEGLETSFTYSAEGDPVEVEPEETAEVNVAPEAPEYKIVFTVSPNLEKLSLITGDDIVEAFDDDTFYVLTDYDATQYSEYATHVYDSSSTSMTNMFNEDGTEYWDDASYTASYSTSVYEFDDSLTQGLVFVLTSNEAEEPVALFRHYVADDTAEDETTETTEDAEPTDEDDTSLDEMIYGDLCYEITNNGYVTVDWLFPAFTRTSAELTNNTGTVLTGDEETLDASIKPNYQSLHPELYIWPELSDEYSRWDYRITDSTTFNSTIKLADGSIIPKGQQTQGDGSFSYDFANTVGYSNGGGSATNVNNAEEGTEEDDPDSITLDVDGTNYKVSTYENYKLQKDQSTGMIAVLSLNGTIYNVKVMDMTEWQSNQKVCYYGTDVVGKDYSIVADMQVSTKDGTNGTLYNIEYTDATGSTMKVPYMSVILGYSNNKVLVVYRDNELEYEYSTALTDIIRKCIEKES